MQKLSSLPQTSCSTVQDSHTIPTTPGMIVSPKETHFIDGIEWGRDCYYDDVDAIINTDGTQHKGPLTLTDLLGGQVRQVKVCDITSTDIMKLVHELIKDPQFRDITQEEKIGCVVGYVMTCVKEYYDPTCPQCGESLCQCQSSSPIQVTYNCYPRSVDSSGSPFDL